MDSGTRSVAIIGSSGGNLRSQGGDDPAGLLSEIIRQLSTAGLTVAAVQFVAAALSMESAAGSTPAALWVLDEQLRPEVAMDGTLEQINAAARQADAALAAQVAAGEIDGLVLVSCDPGDTNSKAIAAAAAMAGDTRWVRPI